MRKQALRCKWVAQSQAPSELKQDPQSYLVRDPGLIPVYLVLHSSKKGKILAEELTQTTPSIQSEMHLRNSLQVTQTKLQRQKESASRSGPQETRVDKKGRVRGSLGYNMLA